jgi:hypothetical protein
MNRYFYSNTISNFLIASSHEIFGELAATSGFTDELTQKTAWLSEISILKDVVSKYRGSIFFEYSIPRIGGRVDVILIINHVVFVLEFKVGEKKFPASALDQVWDYALDLKNFHETSRDVLMAPILISTEAPPAFFDIATTPHNDNLLFPIRANINTLQEIIDKVLQFNEQDPINAEVWSLGQYSPTPTIIEAALALYNQHSVAEISRRDASAINLKQTSNAISDIINKSKQDKHKSICFVTGVPGAGKTLVGLDIATKHMDKEGKSTSVYLSGNGPLVAILREALTRDRVRREKLKGNKIKKGEVFGEVKLIIQNIHNFRDDCLKNLNAPIDHVAVFDEAQRAWNLQQTVDFMKRKRGVPDFQKSEPEFLISCLDRHDDWAVIVCLVGGGQEINTGEAGIGEWMESLNRAFPHWKIYMSSKLTDSEYSATSNIKELEGRNQVSYNDNLHLSVSMRSFRAENVSLLIKNLLDVDLNEARKNYGMLKNKYPIVITRDLGKAKTWLRNQARGTERYGLIVSSKAARLKPYGIDIKTPMNPVNWFLEGKDDIRSSFYLEDVATEFHVQGLELDWACVAWDADFRYSTEGWKYYELLLRSEKPAKWNNVVKEYRRKYLMNAYRVLLTRARQGMIIVVPQGDNEDATRKPEFYDNSFEYLSSIGFDSI